MTSTVFDDSWTRDRDDDVKAVAYWSRLGRLTRRALVVAVAVAVAFTWILVHRAPATFDVAAHHSVWSRDVNLALSYSPVTGHMAPTRELRRLPGVGTVVDVAVERATKRNGVEVAFWTGVGQNERGLAYLTNIPPPWDTCVVHLSGPWWEITPLDISTMNCSPGYRFTGGG